MVQLAFIGLGNMGLAIANNLIAKGNLDSPLLVWNRSAKKYEGLTDQGKYTIASSLEEAISKADIIFTILSNDEVVNAVYDTALKISDGVKGKTFVEASTIHPDTTRGLEKSATEAGAEFVASPVFGAPAIAVAGALVFVLSGSKIGIEKIKPYIVGVTGKQIIDLSDDNDVGKALKLKITGNSIILGMVESLSEAHVLADKSGLGTDNFEKFIEAVFGSSPYLPYSKRLTGGDYIPHVPKFAAPLAAKDARHAISLAKESGVSLPIVEIANKNLTEAAEEFGERSDITSIYGVLRQKAGLPLAK
ncbi:NAD binding domain of 6-phosphogluconate dehydrogenase-domain-containing protein [Lipomyces japonicus]|uniref:NAD binding domain of 6-phosphogluconate dehydrogenase-domain-containing protein n=1 Tax=Lipomyces japonicus TaxID=56871 RepID=UPI0034CD9087